MEGVEWERERQGEGWGVGGENADTTKDGQIDDDEQGKKMERTEARQCL